MGTDTAKVLNWQLCQFLELDPSVPHFINAETDCSCWSSWTRDDSFRIWVEGIDGSFAKGADGFWQSLSEFLHDLAKQGQPSSLEGVAEAKVHPQADEDYEEGCSLVERWREDED